jgi:hypothetical protein
MPGSAPNDTLAFGARLRRLPRPPVSHLVARWANSPSYLSGQRDSQSMFDGFFGAKQEMRHSRIFDADHPAVLVGADNGPTPVEFLLHVLASCLTAGIANIAAPRGVNLTEAPQPSKATSTCSASSGCPGTSAMATSRSRSLSI